MFKFNKPKPEPALETDPKPKKRQHAEANGEAAAIIRNTASQYQMQKNAAVYNAVMDKAMAVPMPTPAQKTPGEFFAMDNSNNEFVSLIKSRFKDVNYGVSDLIMNWYGAQSFIGYQLCSLIAQHWLVEKACEMPARDAVRNGFDMFVKDSDAAEADQELLDQIKELDNKYKLIDNCVEFIKFSRIFGVRHALFIVDSPDPDYYTKPFNLDGVRKGSYRGISQIDPYWITPELDMEAAGNPMAIDFYTPTWWRISGKRVHKSHLIISKQGDVSDIYKPTYRYGGISIPQKIYERVYAAERTANEAPLLAMTKRLNVIHCDTDAALADPVAFTQRMELSTAIRDNYGVRVVDTDETVEQFDTALSDLDEVIMTQYQLCAAISGVPAVKLLETQPNGFNSTGEYEAESYHEMLESIQTHDLTNLINRHHDLCLRSELGRKDIQISVEWKALDVPSAKEQAEINDLRASTSQKLAAVGAIDGLDERQRLNSDPASGYNLEERDVLELPDDDSNPDETDNESQE